MSEKTNNILEIKDLTVHYVTEDETVEAVNNVSLSLKKGEILGLVGETGAGKTTTALSVLNLIPNPPGVIKSGEIYVDGKNVLTMTSSELEKTRGSDVSMIFQDPMTSLNPVFTVGDQIAESVLLHEKCSKEEAFNRACEMLELVGIPRERANEYPHQFSGGMKQRCALVRTLATKPAILLLDEATSALDYQSSLAISNDLYKIIKGEGKTAIMVTHDIGLAASISDRVIVLTKRPARIKNIYTIKYANKSTPIENRKSKEFSKYYELLWRDLDVHI